MAKARQKSLFPELDEIITVLQSGAAQDLVILIIPSHNQDEEPLKDQEIWANAALDLCADLYRGGTGFETFSGVYKTIDGRIIHDKPILVESYVKRADLEDRNKLTELLRFLKRMGKQTKQAAVGLVINNVFHEITDFKGV